MWIEGRFKFHVCRWEVSNDDPSPFGIFDLPDAHIEEEEGDNTANAVPEGSLMEFDTPIE